MLRFWGVLPSIRKERPHMWALATPAMAVCEALERSACDYQASEEEERAWPDECNHVAVTGMVAAYTGRLPRTRSRTSSTS